MASAALENIIHEVMWKEKRNNFLFLTGAGISAESGVPTYRGSDGIWVKGTKYHKPEEFGTWEYFCQNQEEVWQYTMFKKGLVEGVEPNQSHYSIAEIEKVIPERFQLITQNVDGLHLRAGSKNIYEIHGNLRKIRCSGDCKQLLPWPKEIPTKAYTEELTKEDLNHLKCENCGDWLRPHLLWFDEIYNETLFRLYSSLKAAKNAGVVFILGTSGATNLPMRIAQNTLKYGGYVVDINIEDNHFTQLLKGKKRQLIIREKSSIILPEIKAIMEKALKNKASRRLIK